MHTADSYAHMSLHAEDPCFSPLHLQLKVHNWQGDVNNLSLTPENHLCQLDKTVLAYMDPWSDSVDGSFLLFSILVYFLALHSDFLGPKATPKRFTMLEVESSPIKSNISMPFKLRNKYY